MTQSREEKKKIQMRSKILWLNENLLSFFRLKLKISSKCVPRILMRDIKCYNKLKTAALLIWHLQCRFALMSPLFLSIHKNVDFDLFHWLLQCFILSWERYAFIARGLTCCTSRCWDVEIHFSLQPINELNDIVAAAAAVAIQLMLPLCFLHETLSFKINANIDRTKALFWWWEAVAREMFA